MREIVIMRKALFEMIRGDVGDAWRDAEIVVELTQENALELYWTSCKSSLYLPSVPLPWLPTGTLLCQSPP